jgi:hypothetical protein
MDFERILRERLRQAFQGRSGGSGGSDVKGGANVAAALNVNGSGHVTSVYSDEHVTIVQRDGRTQVIRHEEEPPPEDG